MPPSSLHCCATRHWQPIRDGDPRALALYQRHYSCRSYPDGRARRLCVGPGKKLLLLTRRGDALFAWRRFKSRAGEGGVNAAIFRNESNVRSSLLIIEAMAIAGKRWPGEHLYTYVNPTAIRSTNPGCCFLKAGWKRCGETTRRLIILETVP